jgi:recombination protein RecA
MRGSGRLGAACGLRWRGAATAGAVIADRKEPPVSRELERNQANKNRAIAEAVKVIKKQFGDGSIMRLGGEEIAQVEVIPTGSLAIDLALGVGGLPRGRIVEIYGPESSGKTTLTLHAIAEAQARGGVCAFVDAEHALDTDYARRLGVRLDDLLVSQPDCGEQALEITDTLVRTGAIDLIVVDSVAALTPRAEIEGDMGDAHMGLQARLMSQALRKLTAAISRTKTVLIFINQLRQKIGLVFGNPETTTGGNALKFYCSVRLDIRKGKPIRRGEELVGNETRVKVVKNKLAPPFREAHFEILYGMGVHRVAELVDSAETHGVLEKNGAWYSHKGVKLAQGRDKAMAYLDENPQAASDLRTELLARVRSQLPGGGRREPAAVEGSAGSAAA